MRYHDLGLSLSLVQKQYLKDIAESRDPIAHKNKGGGHFWLDILGFTKEEERYINDTVVSKFKIKPDRVTLVNVPPKKLVIPHKDPVAFRRNTTVIFPVYPDPPDYRPAYFHLDEKYFSTDNLHPVPYMGGYLFDTQTRHSVTNNQYYRINLQLWYTENFDDLVEAHKQGELLC